MLRALRNQPGIQGFMKTALELAQEHRFFHWPLEFAEVFSRGGFDVALGNPPWERIKLQNKEFFEARDPEIARAPNKAAAEHLIKKLPERNPALAQAFGQALHAADAAGLFVRASARYPMTGIGDINTYAIFAEAFLNLISSDGRVGAILPPGLLSDDTTKGFFAFLVEMGRLRSAISFENEEFMFAGIANVVRFCLITLSGRREEEKPSRFAFYIRRSDQVTDERRYFSLSADEFGLLNPNTRTCPVFRSQADAELTKKLYQRVPVLIDETKGEAGNPWSIRFLAMFHMANDSSLFQTYAQLQGAGGRLDGMVWTLPSGDRWVPLYEGKFVWHYDHRFGSYHNYGKAKGRGGRGLPPVTESEYVDPHFGILPRYWMDDREVENCLSELNWNRSWLLGWRDVTSAKLERTVVAAAVPRVAVGHKLPLMFIEQTPGKVAALYANLNSLVLDFVARQKIGGTSLAYFILSQLAVLPPSTYTELDQDFLIRRVVELTYTAWDMQPFARDLGYEGEPFRWDPERRAELRAELDAYYAYLYGLSKKELCYVLDPKDIMGEDYPSETFRVLKDNEIRKYGEYRTQRLVLEAYDRFAKDGTFDPARLVDPEYFPVVRAALAVSKSREHELERTLEQLVTRTDQTPLPTLFVEGETDKLIVEGAWRALYPGEPLPVTVLGAGGTMQMRSLAAPGTAMQQLLGDRLVFVLADNDGPGRDLVPNKQLHGGGEWLEQENGTCWCLLAPTGEFRRVMERFKISPAFWPLTIENAFSAALRREAKATGAYWFLGDPQPELLREAAIAKRTFQVFREITEGDDAYFYLMAPYYEAKDAFAAWVTDSARLTAANFVAFEIVLTGLKNLLARRGQPPDQRRTA